MNIEEIALRLIESDCSVDIYFGILDKLEKHTTKIQELEKEKAHIEIAYEEDYKEQQQEIERLNNIIKEAREYIKWHYDLGTEENIEFCLLRDRLLEILDKTDKGE